MHALSLQGNEEVGIIVYVLIPFYKRAWEVW